MNKKMMDFAHTGPGTLMGRYLRLFWQPVEHSVNVPAGRAKPVMIMNVNYTVYRGEDGTAHVTDFRCPHRGTQLSAGWVEGDAIRCFYHGWKFDPSGQCVDQPAEPKPFCDKIRIRAYPCREYLGFVFAYLGEGDPPPFPRYPDFEDFEGILEWDSYERACNFMNGIDNAGDRTHSGFAHRNNPGSFDGFTNSPLMDAKESSWGITISAIWPDQVGISQFGMPNVYHHKSQPVDPTVAIYREFLAWFVPFDDARHEQFTVYAVRLPKDKIEQYVERRERRLAKQTESSMALAARVLRGEIYHQDVDPATTDIVRFQDHVAQVGQGIIPDYNSERLGQADKTMILRRKIYTRELRALATGRPLTNWTYDHEKLSTSRGENWERHFEATREAVAGQPV